MEVQAVSPPGTTGAGAGEYFKDAGTSGKGVEVIANFAEEGEESSKVETKEVRGIECTA
jgi:hypothetical protein